MLVLLVAACGGLEPLDLDPISDEVDERPQISVDAGISADAETTDAADPIDAGTADAGQVAQPPPPPPDDGPAGFIGSACTSNADCTYADSVCLTEGYDRGLCSAPCDRLCPDRDGHPVTFCADRTDVPASPSINTDGLCLSRCDFGLFPSSGCRPGYGCIEKRRANETNTRKLVCVPGEAPPPSSCIAELAAMGVSFEPTVIPDQSPASHPNLTCHVEEPVVLHPPIHGVDIKYYDGSASRNVYGSCAMAKALVATIDDMRTRGVVTLFHIGTRVCRVISGTNTLSRHAYGDAIDIWGFELADGTKYTLLDDWEHNTTNPQSPGARLLYDAAHRWHAAKMWNIILTPNYNAGHDNHFHIDLTPGSDFLRAEGESWIGPAPYAD